MTRKEIVRMFKRFFLMFACCIPIFVGIAFLINGKTSTFVMTLIFIVIGGGAFFIEEVLRNKRRTAGREKRQKTLQDDKKTGEKVPEKPETSDEKTIKTDGVEAGTEAIKTKNTNKTKTKNKSKSKSKNNKRKGR